MVADNDKSKPLGAMVSVRIPEDLKSKLDEIAKQEGKYTSEIVMALIEARVGMKDAGINVKSTHRSMSIDRLLDELIQYRLRHAEILKMIQQKDWYFEDPPEYLKEIKKFFERKLKEIDSELQGLFLQNEQVTCPKCETDMTEKDNELFRTRGSRMNHCNECGSRLERKEVKASKGRSKPRLDDRI